MSGLLLMLFRVGLDVKGLRSPFRDNSSLPSQSLRARGCRCLRSLLRALPVACAPPSVVPSPRCPGPRVPTRVVQVRLRVARSQSPQLGVLLGLAKRTAKACPDCGSLLRVHHCCPFFQSGIGFQVEDHPVHMTCRSLLGLQLYTSGRLLPWTDNACCDAGKLYYGPHLVPG